MLPPNQLLNQHLDNVAVNLRRVKPFTPNDFPAVKRIEQEIRDLPIEHGWGFDSTGMPIAHDAGQVNIVEPINFRRALSDSFELDDGSVFDAPVGVFTHNHPNKITPLSTGDLEMAAGFRLPVRAVATDGVLYRNDGQVTEFNPGSAEKGKLFQAIEENIFNRTAQDMDSYGVDRGRQHVDHQGVVNAIEREDFQRRKRGEAGYSQLPTYEIHDMEPYAVAAANFPTMASDSFAIRRSPAEAVLSQHLGNEAPPARPLRSVYADKMATTPEEIARLSRVGDRASTANAIDPDAMAQARLNNASAKAQEDLQYELQYRQAMADRYSHYGY